MSYPPPPGPGYPYPPQQPGGYPPMQYPVSLVIHKHVNHNYPPRKALMEGYGNHIVFLCVCLLFTNVWKTMNIGDSNKILADLIVLISQIPLKSRLQKPAFINILSKL